MTIKHIFIIGAGTMGNGIAQVAATSGYQVTCMDVIPAALEKAKATIAKSTGKLLEKGTITAEQKANADAIQFVGNMDTMKDADFVIEAATENPELKFKIFKDMDANAREDVILATNTSSISITKIAAQTKRPDKVIGMHFMNPVPLMKLVEIIKGLATSAETLATTLELCKVMGKEPVEANDSPGFISNRILCPRDHPCSQWARGICGIGPVISAGLRAHVDIATSSSVSKLWSFTGLNPTVTWDKGMKRPWNGRLKRLCWIIGESFVKVKGNTSDVYGNLYNQRRAYEDTRKEAGAYADLAAEMLRRKRFGDNQTRKAYEAGTLPKGHLHARAKRYATKLFLSHYWAVAYGYMHHASPPRPWIVTERGGHAQIIGVPNWPHLFPQYV